MRQTPRDDSAERQHYIVDKESFVDITPTLLYSGTLRKLQDWRDSPHSHKFLEIIFIYDGEGVVTIDDKEFAVEKNDVIVYNAESVHYEQSSTDEPLEASFIAFDKIQLKNLPANCILPPKGECIYDAGKYSKVLAGLFDIIKNEISEKNEFYVDIAKNASHALLMYIFRIINEKSQTVELPNKTSVLQKVLYYIDESFLEDIALEEIAEKCFVSKYYLSHLFTKHLGLPIGQYIRGKRIELAKTYLVDTELSSSVIAEKCAFNDVNYFERIFKKATGQTPLQYRKTFTNINHSKPLK